MESTEISSTSKSKRKRGDRTGKGSFKQPLPTYVSSDLIGNNVDLLRQILIHLPEKPLSRFKTVSKIWLSVISDPDFSLRWSRIHPRSASALFLPRNHCYASAVEYVFIPLDSREQVSHPSIGTKIHQSCNGLLLLTANEYNNYVYNPTINQLKCIPKPPQEYYNRLLCINLIFDPLKSRHYKLLSVFYDNKSLIYSSVTNAWRVLSIDSFDTNNRPNNDVIFKAGVFVNGAIHWPCLRKSTSLYFDVDTECFRTMPMPPIQGGEQERTIRYFGESRRHLHMIEYKDDLTLNFDVFEMATDYSNWSVKYNVDLASLGDPVGCLIQRFFILSLVVNGGEIEDEEEEESLVLVMYVPDLELVISYNLKNEKLKKLCHLSLTPRDADLLKGEKWLMVHQFIRSIVEL